MSGPELGRHEVRGAETIRESKSMSKEQEHDWWGGVCLGSWSRYTVTTIENIG